MKRILSIILTLFVFTGFIFAEDDDEGDEYDDGYVYERNGAGDQFLKINLGPFFPNNFGGPVTKGSGTNKTYLNGTLYTGGEIELGYFKFLTNWLAVGGEFTASYNLSVGKKTLVMLPLTGGVLFQPTAGDFEFPIYLEIGMGFESWQNSTYFPSLATKCSAGAYYRINESFSAGLAGSFFWIPQWFKDSSKNANGLFTAVNLGFRYHF